MTTPGPETPSTAAELAASQARAALTRRAAIAQVALPITDPATAEAYLAGHPVRGYADTSFLDALDVSADLVDPATRLVADDPARNTATLYWLTTGPGFREPTEAGTTPLHDARLDSSALSYDQALIALANRVAEVYGAGA